MDGENRDPDRQCFVVKFILLLITLIGAEEVGAETSLLGVRNRTTPRTPVLMVWAYFHYITRNGM